jgi:hypothetical protein
MTARRRVLASRHLRERVRWTGAIAAVAAMAALVALGPPGPARAATNNYDQISGFGQTDSAITVPWTQGLLDNTNAPVASANADRSSPNPTSPLKFMYGDFKNLQVTVSQTQNITHQGVTVTWSGGQPTVTGGGFIAGNYLQMMECYGDSSSGPDPTQCQYGSPIALPNTNSAGYFIGQREGLLCQAGSVPNPPVGLPTVGQSSAALGCDPAEPGTSTSHIAPCPGSDCSGTPPQQFSVPFVPVDGSSAVYGYAGTAQWYSQFDSNEIQQAVTSPGGTGQQQFETLTSTEAPGLGCGALESDGQARGCWLVIVPRGQYEPNGFKIDTNSGFVPNQLINSSPLSAGNWAMRIQIHLDYAPVQSFCPIGTQERETVGTQAVARAVQSWQLALNKAANCSTIFGYSAVPEATSTQQLALSGSGVGMAFTTIPIGSEAARAGSAPASLPPTLYAPVAVSAVGFGFNINQGNGYVTTPVKLTPQLLARALTQSYRTDLPDYEPDLSKTGPAWSTPNPANLASDPVFKQLNPELTSVTNGQRAPLLTEDHSQMNQQIWQWIQADPTASSWLDGTPDPAGQITVDPDFQALGLGKAPAIDSFPRAYSTCLDLGLWQNPTEPTEAPKEQLKCSLDLLPYVNDYPSAASQVLTANDPYATSWNALGVGPDGTDGWWGKNPPGVLGSTWIWGISDTPDLAAFGLIDAQLCDDSGSNCVGPSTASVTAAVSSAKPDSAGLMQVNPATVPAGAYPLVQVIYAAVPTNQAADALNAYADLIADAAGPGQVPGVAPGDLPPGYLPMPTSLKNQALAVVAQLRADAGASSTTPSASTSPGAAGGTNSGVSAEPGGSLSSSSSPSPQPYNVRPPAAQLASSTTQPQPVGSIRWALLAVVIAGAACAVGGTVLRTARVPRWLHRARP